jgi:DNA-binding NarL/FixJ family response regulator
MFGRGIESLLRQQIDSDIVGQESDFEKGMVHIQQLQPDVVVLIDPVGADDSDRATMCILRENPHTKVIDLSLQGNNLRIYRVRQRLVKDLADLSAVIIDDTDGLMDTQFDEMPSVQMQEKP